MPISIVDELYCYNIDEDNLAQICKARFQDDYFTSIPNMVITTKQKMFECGKKYRITIEEIPCEK